MALAVDMMEHGFNGSMGGAILVSGDLDFRPAVEALVRHGVFVHVWYCPDSKSELPGAADFGREIRFNQLYSWNSNKFKDVHHLPEDKAFSASIPSTASLKKGKLGALSVELCAPAVSSSPSFLFWIRGPHFRTRLIHHPDRALLERYVETQYGQPVWESIVG